jgi:K+-transporting ATPase ATPase C chain
VIAVNLTLRQGWVSLRLLVVMTVLLGVVYPFAMFAVGRIVSGTSDGSYVTNPSGAIVGSALIGQSFEGDRWFWSRPSAAGEGYDALSSSGSNLAADNPDLVAAVADRQAAAATADGVRPQDVPADAVTASGSGLDPDISPEYARQQVARVAAARGLDPAEVAALVDGSTEGRLLGFIGEPRVNVLALNLALENLG